MKLLKVGEVAKRAGISVRTLHYYDDIGLIKPSDKSESGFRLYNTADIERLQHVISLKNMGLSLEGIARCLNEGGLIADTLSAHQAVIESKITNLNKVNRTIQILLTKLSNSEELGTAELLKLIKEINDMESTYTPEQLKTLQQRYEKYPEEVKKVEKAWPVLFSKFEDAMKEGLDPATPEVQELAKEAQRYIDMFTGKDKAIEANLDKAYQKNQESALKNWGVSKEVFEYATKARKILNDA